MKMKKLFLLIGSVLVILSCKQPDYFNISGSIDNQDIRFIQLTNVLKGFSDTIFIDEKGQYAKNITFNDTDLIYLDMGNMRNYLFVEPGTSITLNTDPGDSTNLEFDGDLVDENLLIYTFDDLQGEANITHMIYDIGKFPLETFLQKFNEKYESMDSLLSEAQENPAINKDLIRMMNKRLAAVKAQDKLTYPRIYAMYGDGTEQQLGESYFSFLDSIDVNDSELLVMEGGRQFLRSYIEKDVDYNDFKGPSDYYIALIYKASTIFDNTLVTNYVTYSYLKDKINFAGGLGGIKERLDTFMQNSTLSLLNQELEVLAAEWIPLVAGNKAPDFTGYNAFGEKVQLSDYSGNNVYVDVWATWCGPCIREIPSLKEIEREYHDKNIVFISISIDEEEDNEKWLKFIREKDLGGIQVMAKNDWNSEVVKGYNIKGIPRFIMIDSNGKIVSADAPRPSNPDLKVLFEEIGI